ncbi:MAG TPA: hypothetical protein DHM42_05340 [Clostridiales bacterium]|jgi:hypothetical protein|nr:hypothetical protein [Clostridiales bacterium]
MKTYSKDIISTINYGEDESKIKKLVEKDGSVIILKDKKPCYVLTRYDKYTVEKDNIYSTKEDYKGIMEKHGYTYFLGLTNKHN